MVGVSRVDITVDSTEGTGQLEVVVGMLAVLEESDCLAAEHSVADPVVAVQRSVGPIAG